MNTFDKLKIIAPITLISEIDDTVFISNYRGGSLIGKEYNTDRPYNLKIKVDYGDNEMAIEFTSKLLLDRSIELIANHNIRDYFEAINNLGVCRIDTDYVINHGVVVKCDVTKDVVFPNGVDRIKRLLRDNITNYRRWQINYNHRGSVILNNLVTTHRYKKRLIIYDKSQELTKAKNREFLGRLRDAQSLTSYFSNKVRFELNLVSCEQIRQMLRIEECYVVDVLNSPSNPILQFFDEVIDQPQECTYRPLTIRDYERLAVLQQCGYSLMTVEAKLRAYNQTTTSIGRLMQPYRDLSERLNHANTEITDIRQLVA